MSDYDDFSGMDDTDFGGDVINATQDDQQKVARSTGGGGGHWGVTTLLGDAALGAIDLVDTVASSIPGLSRAAGITRGTVNNRMLAAIDSPGLTDFYNQNKAGVNVASAIYGVVGSALVTDKVFRGLSPFMGALKGLPVAKNILTLDRQYAEAMATTRAVDIGIATRGLTGGEVWAAQIPVRTGVVTEMGPSLGTLVNTTRKQAANAVFGKAFGKGVVTAAKQEAVMATFLNQNEFLYTEDTSQNMMWMGLGIAAGGLFSVVGAGYQMRKFANSDTLNRLKAGAVDPTGQEAARISIADVSGSNKTQTMLGHLRGTDTDQITSYMVSAKAKPEGVVDVATFDRFAVQHEKLAMETLGKVTVKGLPQELGTSFGTKDGPYWSHMQGALHKDAGLLYGAEMVGAVNTAERSIGSTHTSLIDRTTRRLDDLQQAMDEHLAGTRIMKPETRAATLLEIKNLNFQSKLTPMVLVDQELMPLSHGAIYDNWVEPTIKAPTKTNPVFEAVDDSGQAYKVGIGTDGDVLLPSVKGAVGTIDNIDHMDALRLYRASQHYITDLARKVGDDSFVWNIPTAMVNGKATPSWFHLDMAEELMKRTDNRAQINWGGLSRETAQKESLIQKIMALKAQNFSNLDEAAVQKLRLRYNLPRLNSYEMGVLGTNANPLDGLIRGSMSMTEDQLRAMSLQEFKEGFAQMSNIGDFAKRTGSDIKELSGNSFRFMLDDAGAPIKPVLIYKRDITPFDYSPDRLAERLAAKKTAQATMLLGNQSGPITREMVEQIMASPDYRLGSNVMGLNDTQIASSLPGAANNASQTAFGALRNAVVTAEQRARDNPAILAITRLRETLDRRMRGIMRSEIEGTFGDSLSILNGPRNLASRTLLDNFHSFRSGWDLEKDSIKIGAENGFVLAETVGNKARWKQQFGTDLPKGQTLVDSRGKEVVLDDMGLDIQQKFNKLTESQRIEKNSILAAQGLPQIRNTTWYVPPANAQGKYIGFALDSKKDVIPGSTIVANTQDAFNRELTRLKADPKSALNTIPGAQFKTQDDIHNFASIWDKAQMEMMNPGTTAIQGEKQSLGKLVGTYTNVNRFDESLRGLRDQYLNHGDDLMQIMLDDAIKAVKTRSNVAGGITRNADQKQTKNNSIYDYWLMAAQGRASGLSEGSATGWLYKGVETSFDNVMRESAPGANKVWSAVTDWLTWRKPGATDARSVKQFNDLSNQLGRHMPFESAADMVERRGMGANPWKLADLTGAGNRFTATWMLRMMEPAAAVMNLAGIVNAMPAVVRNVAMRAGESTEEFAARVGHSSTIFTTPAGTKVSVADMGKIAQRGFKRAWNRASDAEYDYMMKNGFLSQEVAEFQKQFNAIDSTGPVREGLKKLIDKASVLTDKSEDFSRSWGHMIGLEVADLAGVTGQAARHNFAHDIANKMIANYSPLNRPEVFQGAVGAPLGLFQSFMVAYYQRMFRYIETGDARAFATQFAIQGTLFGSKTVPGFSELNNLFFEHSKGDDSPYDALYSKFGENGGDLLMGGVLSNLPKLFGADGVDLYSRGDVSPRILTQNPITNAPAVGAATKLAGGAVGLMGLIKDAIGNGIGLWSSKNPNVGPQQVAEVVSNMMPNRPLAGFVEIAFAGGYDTDRLGQVVTHTESLMDATYRMLGVRSMQQSKEIEAFYANKQAQEIQAGRRDVFNQSMRGSIREGDYDAIPDYVEKYLENGGDPRQVRRMIKSSYEAATRTRGERQLDKALSSNKMTQVNRLMNQGVSIADEENEEDPNEAWGVKDPMDSSTPMATEDADPIAYGLDN